MSGEMTSFLGGYRVLDLTNEVGSLCGKLLGDIGAEVIKIEPPGGDASRNIGPFYKDIPHPEMSLYWFFAHMNKKGITLDIETADGQELFKSMVAGADFVIESFEPGYLHGLGLCYEELEKIRPDLVMTSITPFGQNGPYAHYKTTDLVGVSMAGMVRLYGEFDRQPNRISAPQFYFLGALHGAMGSMMAHYHRVMSGEGQHVDVSCQQGVVLSLMIASEIWDILKVNYRGMGPGFMSPRPTPPGPLYGRIMWPCKDGHVLHMSGGGAQAGMVKSSTELVKMANAEGYCQDLKDYDWSSYDSSQITQEQRNELDRSISEYLLTKTKAELLEAALKREILVVPASDARDVVESPQLVAREFWTSIEHPELGDTLTYPGWPVKWTELPAYRPQRRAPLIGEHNEEVYVKGLGLSREQMVLLKTRDVI